MEIIVAMVLTIIKIVGFILQAVLIIGIIGAVLVGIGLAGIYYNRRQNAKLEATQGSKIEDDFEASYAPRAGKRLITSSRSAEMWRELDRLNDDKILEETKDL